MLALSTIALLVAGSSAADLRGATETSVEKTSTFNLKKVGLNQKVTTQGGHAGPGQVDETTRGYILEWTRVNTDCTGRVEFVGGLSSGATHTISGDDDHATTFYVNAKVDPMGNYTLKSYTSDKVDGEEGVTAKPDWSEPRCSQTISEQIPYDAIRYDGHKGFFYGHTFMAGEYSAVTASLKGFYQEMYGSKNDCLLGVQPLIFDVHWVKGECYFNSKTLETENVMGEVVHDWFKIHGVNATTGAINYAIYNNAECVDKNPFDKKPLKEATSANPLNVCELQDKMWSKFMGYN